MPRQTESRQTESQRNAERILAARKEYNFYTRKAPEGSKAWGCAAARSAVVVGYAAMAASRAKSLIEFLEGLSED